MRCARLILAKVTLKLSHKRRGLTHFRRIQDFILSWTFDKCSCSPLKMVLRKFNSIKCQSTKDKEKRRIDSKYIKSSNPTGSGVKPFRIFPNSWQACNGMKLHLTPREKYPTDLFSERVKDERHLRREQSFLEIRN